MTKSLQISNTLSLPLDAVTQKLAFLGRTGSGKTYGAKRMVEQMLRAGAQVVILDPVGVWPGLRLGPKSFDVPVLGGLFGDIPLEPTAGALIADLAVDHSASMVLDVSQMRDAERTRFAQAFGERFFMRKKAAPGAVHLVLEECQEFVPQNHQPGEEKMLHEFQRIAKLGRNFGIGLSCVSQRPQEVNKKVLNQSECVFAFQMTGPQERKALEYWLNDKGFNSKLSDVLPRLEIGAPYVWSPQWLKISEVVHILPIDSLDTSQTPKVGQKAYAQSKLRPIDLKAISAAMAETVERAKADDPKALRAEIAALKAQANVKPMVMTPAKTVTVNTEVPVFDEADFGTLFEKLSTEADRAAGVAAEAKVAIGRVLVEYRNRQRAAVKAFGKTPQAHVAHQASSTAPMRQVVPIATTAAAGGETERIGRCERGLLTAIAQHGPSSLTQAAIIAGYSTVASTVGVACSKIKRLGLVSGSNALLEITANGVAAIGDYERLPEGGALAEHWYSQLGKCEREMLKIIVDAYPGAVSMQTAATQSGYSLAASTVGVATSKLKRLSLVFGTNSALTANEKLVDK